MERLFSMNNKITAQATTSSRPTNQEAKTQTTSWKGLLGLILLALVIRLYQMAEPSLWQDEVWSVYLAQQPLAKMFEILRSQDLQPPLYYLLLKTVIWLGPDNNFLLRGLATLFDLIALWPLYLLARRMAGERAAQIALLLFSLSSIHVIYSQMVRMYTLLALLVLTSCYLFWRIMEEEKPGWPKLLGYVAATTAMLYTQNLSPLYLVVQGLALLLLFRRKSNIIRATLIWAICLLLWSPLLLIFLQQAGGNTFFAKPDLLFLLDSFVAFGAADRAHNGQPFALLALIQPYFAVLGLGLLVWLGLGNLRQRKAERTYLLLFWLVPLLLCWLISQVKSVYADRAFLASSFPFFILMGAAFTSFEVRLTVRGFKPPKLRPFWGPLIGGVLTLILSVASILILASGGYLHDDLRGLGRDASLQLTSGGNRNFLLQFNGNSPIIFDHYLLPSAPPNISGFTSEVEAELNRGPGRVCAITSTSTVLLEFAREPYQRFQTWLITRSSRKQNFHQSYSDESLTLECWGYIP